MQNDTLSHLAPPLMQQHPESTTSQPFSSATLSPPFPSLRQMQQYPESTTSQTFAFPIQHQEEHPFDFTIHHPLPSSRLPSQHPLQQSNENSQFSYLQLYLHEHEEEDEVEDLTSYLIMDKFSPIQNHVICSRINGRSYSEIFWDEKQLYNRQISKCLKRSALGFSWNIPCIKGPPMYLCSFDTDILVEEVQNTYEHGTPFDTYELLDRAQEIREERICKRIKFLMKTGSDFLAEELLQKCSKPPSRAWINCLLARTQLQLRDRRNIKLQRLTACSPEIFESYFNIHAPIIPNACPYLIFGADETILETLLNGKIIVPEGVTEAIAAEIEQFPHISVMCCNSVLGDVMPPFMILPTITTLPDELRIFTESEQIDVACAPSGYMNRDCFVRWTITFINHLNIYRLKLPLAIRNQRAVLIMDGHSSRACPLALWLLDRANVEVIIEQANTSHIVQMFDV